MTRLESDPEPTMAATTGGNRASAAAPELLKTKLFLPRWRDGMISRPHLLDQLTAAATGKLTVLSAPAGFGKSTLVAEWIASGAVDPGRVGGVSLDPSDNDPGTFWNYVLAALDRVDAGIGARAAAMLNAAEPPVIESVLTSAINDVSSCDGDIALVLDDFHVIEDQRVIQALEFLILNQPPNMRVFVSSRSDPPLPVARLRGSGEALELRAADLRFTEQEATAFLNTAMGLQLSQRDIAALESRTEGWIAGLQLAALSLRGRSDASHFIDAFAGDDRFVVDYLVDEVLNRQSEAARSFLLRTAILDRLCGSLCDALDGGDGGQAMLESLERANVFLVPLDDKRHWYRYHHLFADVLRAHARADHPEQIPIWHHRASVWFQRNGAQAEAIHHALAAGDTNHAADLVELAWRPMDANRRVTTWRTWAEQLPVEQLRARPVLGVAYAWALLEEGELQAGDDWLTLAEQRLPGLEDHLPASETHLRVVDEAEFEHLAGSLAAARAFHALAVKDVDGAAEAARRALAILPEREHERRAAPAALLALAAWTRGDLDEAAQALSDAIAGARMLDNTRFVINGSFVLGELLRGQGRLDAARDVYAQVLRTNDYQSLELASSTADLHTGLAELHLLRFELDDAERALARSRELAETAGLPHWRHRWLVATAGLHESRGNLDLALDALDDAAACYTRGPVPEVRPIGAYRARLLIAAGRLAEADRSIAKLPVPAQGHPDYLQEYGQLTLARQIIARQRASDASRFRAELFELLTRLLDAAGAQRRIASQIEILALEALALDAFGARQDALEPLKQALDLAKPPGLARTFLGAGAPMCDLLRACVAAGEMNAFLARLLPAFDQSPEAAVGTAGQVTHEPIEALTERERDVLRLIAAGMRNKDIADQLFVSLSTVKRHIANAYGKLGVHSRTEAVARANELKLL